MDSSVGSILDYSLLDSLEWSGKSDTLSSFLDQFGSSLPHVVRVLEGFLGDAYSRTIDSGQILILHSLLKETKLLAQDARNTDLYIPKNFQVKVEMIPKNSVSESKSVKELLQTFPKYFRVLDDIPSHDITSGSMFKIIRQKGYGYFECLQIINNREEREVRLPFSLKGRFQALQDSREFFIDEVYVEELDNIEANLPVNVRFVKSSTSRLSVPGLNIESLYELGTLCLVAECDTETVFASVLTSEENKTLAILPRDLEITVQPVKASEHYEKLRQTIAETQFKTLKRIERLNKLSLYWASNPVRQFSQIELAPPAFPNAKTRTKSEMEPSGTAVAKMRSNSTPPLPHKKPMETRSKGDSKKPLKQSISVPAAKPTGDSDQHTKDGRLEICKGKYNPSLAHVKQRPSYKPPAIPRQTEPPLPPKESLNSLTEGQKNIIASGHSMQATYLQAQNSDSESPPIPPPRLRRRLKPSTTPNDVRKSVDLGIEQVDDLVGQENEHMDGSWMGKPDGTLEEIFGDIDDKADGTTSSGMDGGIDGKASGSEVNEKAQRNDKEMVVLSDDDNEQRERAESVDYENTKNLKLIHAPKDISKEKVLPKDDNEPRKRAESVDHENTKELKLVHSQKDISKEKVLPDDDNEPRERADSVDYENTKNLKLIHAPKDIFREKGLPDNQDEQRVRADSVDYENTKKLQLVPPPKAISREKVLAHNANEQNEREYSVDNPIELVSPGKEINGQAAVNFDTSEVIPRIDSIDYENTKDLKLKIPSKTKLNQVSRKGQASQDDTESKYSSGKSQLLSPYNKVDAETTLISDQKSSNLESISGSSCGKSVAKTEQFLKDMKIYTFHSTSKINGTKEEFTTTQTQDTSDGIYYTSMAENVADDPSYTTMSLDTVHLERDANDEATYMPMDHGSNVDVDSSIYENDISNSLEYDSDDNYEPVDPVKCMSRKTNRKRNEKVVDRHRSYAYEEVDIIQKIGKNKITDDQNLGYERMDISQLEEPIPLSKSRSGSENSYEEVDPPLKPGSNKLNIIPRGRSGSDNSYEDVDFSTNAVQSHLTKKTSNDISVPPTPPQRRKRSKSITGCVIGGDQKDKSETLSSPKSGGDNQSEDFEDLESLQVHLAEKESERKMLFDKAKASYRKEPPNSDLPKESQEASNAKDVTKPVVDPVSNKQLKSRPPAPPPRKPVNYLDVEPKGNPELKPFKKKPPCNYSEIIGKVKPSNPSKEDDLEYVDDIELYYFQKEHIEAEKKRREKNQSKESNIEVASSDVIKSKVTEKEYEEEPSSKEVDISSSGETEIKDDNAFLKISSPTQQINSNIETENPQKLAQNDSKPVVTKYDSHVLKKPIMTKPPPKKPIVKKKPSRVPSEPMISPHHSSHDTNKPIKRHSSEKPVVAKKPLTAKRSLPPPKPKRTFEFTQNDKSDFQNTSVSTNTTICTKDASYSCNGKSIQTSENKQSSSEDKVTPQRRPPKPLPRRKSNN